MEKKVSRKKTIVSIIILAVVAVVLLLGYYLWQNGGLEKLKVPSLLGKQPFQAVFLSNGQVYFGQASNLNGNYVTLRNVYYLQVGQVLQPVQDKQAASQPQTSISLAKLGATELHKPKDEMKINRTHVIFIEDLEEASQVVKAIKDFEATLK